MNSLMLYLKKAKHLKIGKVRKKQKIAFLENFFLINVKQSYLSLITGALSGLRQFLTIENPLKL